MCHFSLGDPGTCEFYEFSKIIFLCLDCKECLKFANFENILIFFVRLRAMMTDEVLHAAVLVSGTYSLLYE